MSLQERLDKGGPLELKEILRIGAQTAMGLAAAHAQGLVHRDVKPANILLENGVQRVKITDFGLARAADDASLTQSGVVAGTPQYMAPEQASGEAVDHRADLFSLGSVLYAMCTGRPPFCASTAMAVLRRVSDDSPRPIRELNPEIPGWLIAIVDKLHAKNPADRFQSARQVAELLNQHLAQLQHASWTPLPGAPAEKPSAEAASVGTPITSLTICPSCGSRLHVPDKMVGQVASCPECDKPFQVADSSQEIQVIQAAKRDMLVSDKPKWKIAPWGCLLGGFAVLFLLFCGAVLRTRVSYEVGAPATVYTEAATAVEVKKTEFEEALSWFPEDATFFGTLDIVQVWGWGPYPADLEIQQKLFDRLLGPHIRRHLEGRLPGVPRLHRVSFAYREDSRRPEMSTRYVRLTGQFDHQQVLSLLSRETPKWRIQEFIGFRTPIATIQAPNTPWVCGLVGNTDVILAGYRGAEKAELDHFIPDVLQHRDGRGTSLAKALSTDLQLAPPSACGLLIGRIPSTLSKQSWVRTLFPVLPYQATVYLVPIANVTPPDFQVRWDLRLKEPGQDRQFVASVARLKREGVDMLLKAYPQIANLNASEQLRAALEGIQIDADQGVVSGDLRITRSTVQALGLLLKQVLTRD